MATSFRTLSYSVYAPGVNVVEFVPMSDRFVTIAAFDSPVEAHIVRGLLDEDGVRAMLGGENATAVFAGLSLAEITLQVHESDLDRAEALLDEYENNADEPGLVDDEPEETGWVCSLCGELVDDTATDCPSCQTPRDAVRNGRHRVGHGSGAAPAWCTAPRVRAVRATSR